MALTPTTNSNQRTNIYYPANTLSHWDPAVYWEYKTTFASVIDAIIVNGLQEFQFLFLQEFIT